MKKLSYLFLLSAKGYSQFKTVFSKDPIINLENFQKQQIYYGYFGFNSFDFKVDYKTGLTHLSKKNYRLLWES
jgi:hypothetical protein